MPEPIDVGDNPAALHATEPVWPGNGGGIRAMLVTVNPLPVSGEGNAARG